MLHPGQTAFYFSMPLQTCLMWPHQEYILGVEKTSRYHFQHHFALWPVHTKTWTSWAKLVTSSKMTDWSGISKSHCQSLILSNASFFAEISEQVAFFPRVLLAAEITVCQSLIMLSCAVIIPTITISLLKVIHNTIPLTCVLYHKVLCQSQCNFHCVLRIHQPPILQSQHFL